MNRRLVLAALLAAGAARADTIRTYAYDSQGRVTRIECGGRSVSYTYDYQGRLYSRTGDGGNGARKQLYSGAQVVAEYGAGGKRYLCGPGIDNVLGFHDGAARYLHRDGLGSVTLATDGSNEVLERVSYDAFGMPTFRDAEYGPAESATGNRQLFTGREWEGELGLYNYRARFYAPEAGRFVSPDPIGVSGGLNLYGYCGNNPVNRRDPDGRNPVAVAVAEELGPLFLRALGGAAAVIGAREVISGLWDDEVCTDCQAALVDRPVRHIEDAIVESGNFLKEYGDEHPDDECICDVIRPDDFTLADEVLRGSADVLPVQGWCSYLKVVCTVATPEYPEGDPSTRRSVKIPYGPCFDFKNEVTYENGKIKPASLETSNPSGPKSTGSQGPDLPICGDN